MKRIGIIGGGLAPLFNEAMANQMQILSKKYNLPVVTFNDIGLKLYRKQGLYIIFNSKFLINRIPFLSQINALLIFLVIKKFEKKFDIILLPGGIKTVFLKYLDAKKCIPIINSIPDSDETIDERKSKLYPTVIAQSNKTRNQLVTLGIKPEKIKILYPLIDTSKFYYHEIQKIDDNFRILFASAPNIEVPGENNFEDKGITLLLESFKEFLEYHERTTLYLIWRNYYNSSLRTKIKELQLENKVKIFNKFVKMEDCYPKIDLLVIPYKNIFRSPEIPSSALESIFSGRPVLATDIGEIAEIINQYKCGYVSKPIKNEFVKGFIDCLENYEEYHKNCLKFSNSDYITPSYLIDEIILERTKN